jgi:phosphoglycolate phosphatase
MAVKLILFDFDGTIADTYHTFVEITNNLAEEFGYQPVTPEEVEQLRNLSSREIVNNSGISPLKLFCVLRRIRQELNKKVSKLKPIEGIEIYLSQLKEGGYQLGIVTSNRQDNVLAFLNNNKLGSLFSLIYSGTSLFGKHKVINRILWQNHLKPNEVIYVGDETRDIDAAKQSKVKVIAVAWGFNSPAILAQHQPDFLIEQPPELIEAIESWENIHKTSCRSQAIG